VPGLPPLIRVPPRVRIQHGEAQLTTANGKVRSDFIFSSQHIAGSNWLLIVVLIAVMFEG